MADVTLVREVIFVISKEIVDWLLPKRVLTITESVKMNLSPTQRLSVMELTSELGEIRGITYSVGLKEKIWNIVIF